MIPGSFRKPTHFRGSCNNLISTVMFSDIGHYALFVTQAAEGLVNSNNLLFDII